MDDCGVLLVATVSGAGIVGATSCSAHDPGQWSRRPAGRMRAPTRGPRAAAAIPIGVRNATLESNKTTATCHGAAKIFLK